MLIMNAGSMVLIERSGPLHFVVQAQREEDLIAFFHREVLLEVWGSPHLEWPYRTHVELAWVFDALQGHVNNVRYKEMRAALVTPAERALYQDFVRHVRAQADGRDLLQFAEGLTAGRSVTFGDPVLQELPAQNEAEKAMTFRDMMLRLPLVRAVVRRLPAALRRRLR